MVWLSGLKKANPSTPNWKIPSENWETSLVPKKPPEIPASEDHAQIGDE
ncbi:hypothetical protein ACFSTC_58020 [Nonomuraea ferruginea]